MATKKMKFRVLAGDHLTKAEYDEDTGKVSSPARRFSAKDPKNNIIESDKDLTKIFPNKFERVADDEGGKAGKGVPLSTLGVDGKTKPIELGTMDIKSPVVAETPTGSAEEEDEDVEGADAEAEEEDATSKLGEDVTSDYTAAKKAGLLVFKNGRDFFVSSKDDPNDALNPKPLKQAKVDEFLKKQKE